MQRHTEIGKKSGKIQTAGYIGLTEPIFLFTTPFSKTHWNEKSNVKIKINWHFLWKDRRVYHQSTRTVRNFPMIQTVGTKLIIKHNIPDYKMTPHKLRREPQKASFPAQPTPIPKMMSPFQPSPSRCLQITIDLAWDYWLQTLSPRWENESRQSGQCARGLQPPREGKNP